MMQTSQGNLKRATTTTSAFILGTLDAASKVSFNCGRQKRDNTNAVKMLHQMSVCIVVVALGLVLNYRLSINSRRMTNGNGNYYLTGKLIPNHNKTAGNHCGPLVGGHRLDE